MSDVYFKKYLKYKNKYLNLKKFSDKNVNHLSGAYEIPTAEKIVFNNETLKNAVDEYIDDEEAARIKYGDISGWNVSQVTDMSGLFSGHNYFNGNISSWDVNNVINMERMFHYAESFNQPLDNWNVSNVTNMKSMFDGDISFNQPLNNWDVSNVTNMERMFYYAESFNQPLDKWKVGNVTSMEFMFSRASSFNQPLNNWKVGNVTSMEFMFSRASSFNQPLNKWNVSNVTTMVRMFEYAKSFNQPLDKWDVSNVTNMQNMFYNAKSFNQPLDKWDVSNVIDMEGMFADSTKFNQPLNIWNVSNVTTMAGMFENAIRFNQPLDNWNVSNVTNMVYMFYGAESFNQPLNNWDVSKLPIRTSMFDGAISFNPDFSPNFLKIKFNNAIKEIKIIQRKKCIDENHYKSLTDRKILDFIENYKLNHYCLKESNGFVDVRPKNHLHFNPTELEQLTIKMKNGENFFYRLNNFFTTYILDELFTDGDCYYLNNMSYYASTEYLGPINLYPKPADTLDLIKNGLRVEGVKIPKPNQGERQIVPFSSSGHAMLLIREDDKLYFFDPNSTYQKNKHYQEIIEIFPLICSFFEDLPVTEGPFVLYPNINNNQLSINSYGICYAICEYLKMIFLLNKKKSIQEIMIYFFKKLLYNKLKCNNSDNYEEIFNEFKTKYTEYFNDEENNLTTSNLKGISLNIGSYISTYACEVNKKVIKSYELMIISYLLFIAEFNLILICKLNEFYESNSFDIFPDFLNKLGTTERLERFTNFEGITLIEDDSPQRVLKYHPLSLLFSSIINTISFESHNKFAKPAVTYKDDIRGTYMYDEYEKHLPITYREFKKYYDFSRDFDDFRVIYPYPVFMKLSQEYLLPKSLKFDNENLKNGVSLWTVDKILAKEIYGDINEWDVSQVTDMSELFLNQESFNDNISDWNVSNVTNMEYMFFGASSFNQPLNDWDVGKVENMESMFNNATNFNQPLNNWKVGNVTSMESMFLGSSSFNQPLNNWNVGNVTSMESVFFNCKSFNQPLNDWDVSKVENMSLMFNNATNFNQSLNNWNVSNVTNMGFMFDNATSFNQPLNNWDVSKVTYMNNMFFGASSFNQPLNDWDVGKVENMSFMFKNATSFNQDISMWNVNNVSEGIDNFNKYVSKYNELNDIKTI